MLIKERIQLTDQLHLLNITAYNQKDRATPFRKRKSNSTSLHNYSFTKMRASTTMSETQPAPQKCKSVEKQTTDIHSFKNTANHNHHKKRKHITDYQNNTEGISIFTKNGEKEVNKDQLGTTRRKSQVGYILQSKRSTIGPISITSKINYPKKSKCGKQLVLKDSHFLSWINQVLLQSCDQKFDRTIALCAVKKYMIDSASLAAFGISQSQISRIYRSLHVYSVGFSKLIKETRGVSTKAYKNIWKVYSILLQHCSTGDFQTMMSEMESENVRKIQKLQDELQQKQQIIQQNDELNRQKNSKVFKELKALKEENFQLILEKDVIGSDAREFQKAFNQEVSLRMLFQQKISSIYCLYNELSGKHSILYKDFHNKTTELEIALGENKRISEENENIKKEIIGIEFDKKILNHQLTQLKDQLTKLENQYRKKFTHDNELKFQHLNMSKDLIEVHQECKKMAKEVQIMKENNKLLLETNHLQQLEYQQCLSQNKKLLSTLQQQYAINKRYFQERQKLDRGLVNYQNEKIIYLIKIQDRQKIIDEFKIKIQALQEKINGMQGESEFAEENIKKLNEDVILAQENRKKLKVINQRNQRIIEEQQMKITILENQLQKIVPIKQQSEDTTKEQAQKINQLECKNKTLSLANQILNQKLSNQIKARQKAKQIQAAERRKNERQLNIVRKDFMSKQIQVDKLKQVYESTSLQLKNERFEMKNLQLSYKQCLTVIDSYTKVIKDINAKHSNLEDKLQQQKRVSKIRQHNYNIQFKKLSTQNKILKDQINEMTEFRLKHKNCIHPMIYQDIHSRLERLQQNQGQREKVVSNLRRITKEGQQRYKQTVFQREKQIDELNKKLTHTEQKLLLQIEYQRKKTRQLSQELSNLQLQLISFKNSYKYPVQYFKEKEKRYLEIIKEKKQKVDTLVSQIQIMNNRNHKLAEQITYSQNQLSSHRQKLLNVQQNLLVLQNEKQKDLSQRDQAINQVQEIIKQLKIELPKKQVSTLQQGQLMKTGSDLRSSNVYMQQKVKSIKKHRGQAQRQVKNIEEQNNDIIGENQNKTKIKNRSQRDRRQDFAHKFKNASQYYIK